MGGCVPSLAAKPCYANGFNGSAGSQGKLIQTTKGGRDSGVAQAGCSREGTLFTCRHYSLLCAGKLTTYLYKCCPWLAESRARL